MSNPKPSGPAPDPMESIHAEMERLDGFEWVIDPTRPPARPT